MSVPTVTVQCLDSNSSKCRQWQFKCLDSNSSKLNSNGWKSQTVTVQSQTVMVGKVKQ